jgi:hypothetical protein
MGEMQDTENQEGAVAYLLQSVVLFVVLVV